MMMDDGSMGWMMFGMGVAAFLLLVLLVLGSWRWSSTCDGERMPHSPRGIPPSRADDAPRVGKRQLLVLGLAGAAVMATPRAAGSPDPARFNGFDLSGSLIPADAIERAFLFLGQPLLYAGLVLMVGTSLWDLLARRRARHVCGPAGCERA